MKQTKQTTKRKIENNENIVDNKNQLKKTLRNLNDEKFVNFSQYLHEFNQVEIVSQIFKRKKQRRQSIEHREKKN